MKPIPRFLDTSLLEKPHRTAVKGKDYSHVQHTSHSRTQARTVGVRLRAVLEQRGQTEPRCTEMQAREAQL